MLLSSLRTFAFFLLVSTCLSSQPAWAQDSAAAEALFRSAQKAADQGDWVTACDRFEESHRLDPAPGTVLNIARCRERLGQVASAWENYREAGELLPAGDRRAQYARARAEELSPRVPRLTLHAPAADEEETSEVAVPEYKVLVQKTEFATASLGVPLPFDPGLVRIVVRAPEREDFSAEVRLKEGDRLELQLEIGPKREPGSAADAEDAVVQDSGPPGRTSSRTPIIISYSVGALGVGAAIGGGIWAALELPIANGHCFEGDCDRRGADASARGRTAVVMTAVGAGAAIVGVTLGTVLLLRSKSSSANEADSLGSDGGWSLALQPRPGGALLSWQSTLGRRK